MSGLRFHSGRESLSRLSSLAPPQRDRLVLGLRRSKFYDEVRGVECSTTAKKNDNSSLSRALGFSSVRLGQKFEYDANSSEWIARAAPPNLTWACSVCARENEMSANACRVCSARRNYDTRKLDDLKGLPLPLQEDDIVIRQQPGQEEETATERAKAGKKAADAKAAQRARDAAERAAAEKKAERARELAEKKAERARKLAETKAERAREPARNCCGKCCEEQQQFNGDARDAAGCWVEVALCCMPPFCWLGCQKFEPRSQNVIFVKSAWCPFGFPGLILVSCLGVCSGFLVKDDGTYKNTRKPNRWFAHDVREDKDDKPAWDVGAEHKLGKKNGCEEAVLFYPSGNSYCSYSGCSCGYGCRLCNND